ncbi:MATE family efflux transporter, partial [Parafannyhessea umbonata]|uniref:MATE family efflux transporter n=1 Tax=Parafannyhessea umbonata TaxID=604330 RepID=UPI002A83C68C
MEKTHEPGELEQAGATGGLSGTAARKYRQMTESPVPRLVLSLAWPSIVSNLVTTVYNLADTFFIGQISTSAEGAIGVAFVVMTLIQAVGFYFGQGTGNAMSRYLGMRNQRMADTMASV